MIQLTDSAAKRILEVVESKENIGGLRLGVHGGGCSGFSYALQFDAGAKPQDEVFEHNGAKVFVDPKSMKVLDGMVLDFKADLMQQGFVFNNPNATQTCGCGTSFSA